MSAGVETLLQGPDGATAYVVAWWPRQVRDVAVRIAVRLVAVAASLCPALSSLGGAVVGTLLAVATCATGRRARPDPDARTMLPTPAGRQRR